MVDRPVEEAVHARKLELGLVVPRAAAWQIRDGPLCVAHVLADCVANTSVHGPATNLVAVLVKVAPRVQNLRRLVEHRPDVDVLHVNLERIGDGDRHLVDRKW